MALIDFQYPEDVSIPEDFPEREYTKSNPTTPEQTGKFGQLKLFVTELFFLCNYWDPSRIKSPTVLYIGAGPGHHLVTLVRMFPTINWELYDLQEFAPGLKDLPNVTLFEKYFEDSDIPRYSNRDDVFLICDIRSLTYKQGDVKWTWSNESKVIEDMKLQESWVLKIKPVWGSLKFRLPYAQKEVIKRLGDSWNYLDGQIYIQPWIGLTSSETRLIVSRDNLIPKDWDYSKYERQMSYHNGVRRLQKWRSKYSIEYDSRKDPSKSPVDSKKRYEKNSKVFVLSNYYDSIVTMETLAHYFRRAYPSKSLDIKTLKSLTEKIIVPIVNLKDVEDE